MKLNELLAFDEIVVQCHDYPDADTVAAGFAVSEYLKSNGKSVRLVYSGNARITKPNLVVMIERLSIPLEYVIELEKPQLLLTVDCVCGERNVTAFEAENYAAIDHHHVNADVLPKLCEVRDNYGSCSSVVAKMLEAQGRDINENGNVATALYYGLYMDTNGFSEISHPADRDLRDFAKYDNTLIGLLRNTNLSLEELNIAGDALNSVEYIEKYSFAITKARPCDPNILGFISDLVLQVDKVLTCVVCCDVASHGTKLSVRSCTNDMRADELATALTKGIGNGGGHRMKAGGFIRKDLTNETENIMEIIKERACKAFDEYEILYADSICPDDFDFMPYKKLRQTIGYTRSADIMPAGSKILIRTLEADLNVETSEDIYIMVSAEGGIYPINRAKFEKTYEAGDKPYVMEQGGDYSPRIISVTPEGAISLSGELLKYAKQCTSREAAGIYAAKLTKNVKLYTKWDSVNYMLGKTGDYIAVRKDDKTDAYIIRSDIFSKSYCQGE